MASGRRPRINLRLIGERQINRLLYPEADAIQAERPKTRGDCVNGIRPCPWVGCRHHLYLNVSEATGSMTQNFPKTPVWDLKESCSLDVVDKNPGGLNMTELGELLSLTKERIRQIEEEGERTLRETSADQLGREPYKAPSKPAPPPVVLPPPVRRRPPTTPPKPAPPTVMPARRIGPQLVLWVLPAVPRVTHPRGPATKAPPVEQLALGL